MLEARPNFPKPYICSVSSPIGRAGLDEAIEQVKRATKFVPRNALFHAHLAEMYRQARRPRRAVEQAGRAVALDPAMAASRLAHGDVFNSPLEHFRAKACPRLDPGWVPVRVRKRVQTKRSKPWRRYFFVTGK
jgi:tetratricopeptide (TPR) repeat protein